MISECSLQEKARYSLLKLRTVWEDEKSVALNYESFNELKLAYFFMNAFNALG